MGYSTCAPAFITSGRIRCGRSGGRGCIRTVPSFPSLPPSPSPLLPFPSLPLLFPSSSPFRFPFAFASTSHLLPLPRLPLDSEVVKLPSKNRSWFVSEGVGGLPFPFLTPCPVAKHYFESAAGGGWEPKLPKIFKMCTK